jgi:hypothetical protein
MTPCEAVEKFGERCSPGIIAACREQGGKNLPESKIIPEEWPKWALRVKLLKSKSDKGVGDTLSRLFGGKITKWAYSKLKGGDCGCSTEQERLNQKYPYK